MRVDKEKELKLLKAIKHMNKKLGVWVTMAQIKSTEVQTMGILRRKGFVERQKTPIGVLWHITSTGMAFINSTHKPTTRGKS